MVLGYIDTTVADGSAQFEIITPCEVVNCQ